MMEGILLQYSHWDAKDVIVTEEINLKQNKVEVSVDTYDKRPIYSQELTIVSVNSLDKEI